MKPASKPTTKPAATNGEKRRVAYAIYFYEDGEEAKTVTFEKGTPKPAKEGFVKVREGKAAKATPAPAATAKPSLRKRVPVAAPAAA